jgi:hypothetical protein
MGATLSMTQGCVDNMARRNLIPKNGRAMPDLWEFSFDQGAQAPMLDQGAQAPISGQNARAHSGNVGKAEIGEKLRIAYTYPHPPLRSD